MGSASPWEDRYRNQERVWSRNPNPSLVKVASELPVGAALDLGCGEGADAIWLANQGWSAHGIDISATAISRAREIAEESGARSATFEVGDATNLGSLAAGGWDLVAVSYLHMEDVAKRTVALQAAVKRVAPGGHLLLVFHGPRLPGVFSGPDPVDARLALDLIQLPEGTELIHAGLWSRGEDRRQDSVALVKVGASGN